MVFLQTHGLMAPASRRAGRAGRRERLQHHGQRPRRGGRGGAAAAAHRSPPKGGELAVLTREGSPCAWAEAAVMSLGESTEQQSTVEGWHCLMKPVLWERDLLGYGETRGGGAKRHPAVRVQQQGLRYLTSESGLKPDEGSSSSLSSADPIP